MAASLPRFKGNQAEEGRWGRRDQADIWYGHKQMILKQGCSSPPLWTYPVISWYISEVKEAKDSEASNKLRERIN